MSPILFLIITVFFAGCAVGAFFVLVLGIRAEERHMTLHRHDSPQTLTGASTRRLLGHVSRRPDNDVTKFAI